MKKRKIIPLILVSVMICLFSCSRRDVLVEQFHVEKNDFLSIPVKHVRFPYPQTNIFIDFDPAIKNHPERDFSDILKVKVYGKKNINVPLKQIYDINGVGQNIEISFLNEKEKITKIEILFGQRCSGRIEIISWQPL